MVCDWWIWIRFVCFCVSRFVACDRNYDRRQRKTQLWRRLLNFRVRMFVKSAVNQKAENLMKQPQFPSLRDNARTYSRGTRAHLFFLSLFVPSRPGSELQRNFPAIFDMTYNSTYVAWQHTSSWRVKRTKRVLISCCRHFSVGLLGRRVVTSSARKLAHFSPF